MKYVLSLIVVVALSQKAFSQGEDNNWIFGGFSGSDGAGISFASDPPAAITSGIHTLEGCASISDAAGNLLMYSDGKRVWNSAHTIMPDGSSLIATDPSSSTQASVIVPVPGSATRYYVFSLEDYMSPGRLYASVVDMTLDGGLGNIVTAESPVLLDSALDEKMTTVAGDCEDIWLVVHSKLANEYKAFHITTDGIDPNPVISTIDIGDPGTLYNLGVIKFSPDRTKMGAARYFAAGTDEPCVELYDFNPTTGILSNRIGLLDASTDYFNSAFYGISFSPDNSKLYASSTLGGFDSEFYILQFDLSLTTAADLNASATNVADESAFFGDMRLAKNGKIYIAKVGNEIASLESPNLTGTACSYLSNAITLAGSSDCTYGISNVVTLPIAKIDSNQVMVHDIVTCSPTAISGRQDATAYLWSTGATTESITATPPGVYWVRSKNGCFSADTFRLTLGIAEEPQLSVSDVTICPEQELLQVHAEADASGTISYLWGPAGSVVSGIDEATATINTNTTSQVFVTVTNQKDLCSAMTRDTIHIGRFPPPVFDLLNNDTLICQGEVINLEVEGPGSAHYQWTPEGRIEDPLARHTVVYSGPTDRYYITIKDENGCVASDSFLLAARHCCTVLVPDAFSPNGDGINDVFSLKGEISQRINEFSIFNRLGQRIYLSTRQEDTWDGTYSSKECDMGVYFYYLRYTCSDGNEYVKKGDITLVR